jgi:hypothetical protein
MWPPPAAACARGVPDVVPPGCRRDGLAVLGKGIRYVARRTAAGGLFTTKARTAGGRVRRRIRPLRRGSSNTARSLGRPLNRTVLLSVIVDVPTNTNATFAELPRGADGAVRELYSRHAKALHNYVEQLCPDRARPRSPRCWPMSAHGGRRQP